MVSTILHDSSLERLEQPLQLVVVEPGELLLEVLLEGLVLLAQRDQGLAHQNLKSGEGRRRPMM